MKTKNILTVEASDFNQIDQLNGQATIAKKGGSTATLDSEGKVIDLKGALQKYNGTFSQLDEINFIKGVERQMFEYQTEQFVYENLPKGLDKYRVEKKILENGAVAIVKLKEKYYALRFTTKQFNIYDEVDLIKIVEPRSDVLNGMEYDVKEKDVAIIRNNIRMQTIFKDIYRYIRNMERTLFQIEKNLTSSAPKGLINLKNSQIEFDEDGDSPYKSAMEYVANSQDTFFVITAKPILEQDAATSDAEQYFTPMELTDRTETLIRNYTFFKEQVKELVGVIPNTVNPKKARLTEQEASSDTTLPNSTKQHAIEVRKIDWENFNEVFNENVVIEAQSDERPADEEYDEEGNLIQKEENDEE